MERRFKLFIGNNFSSNSGMVSKIMAKLQNFIIKTRVFDRLFVFQGENVLKLEYQYVLVVIIDLFTYVAVTAFALGLRNELNKEKITISDFSSWFNFLNLSCSI